MDEDRYQEALEMWFAGKHKEAVGIFLAEAEPFYIAAATLDILDRQGRGWALFWGGWESIPMTAAFRIGLRTTKLSGKVQTTDTSVRI